MTKITQRIAIELNHPAHYHLFKNIAHQLSSKGFEIKYIVREKDVLLNLVDSDGIIEYYCRKSQKKKDGLIHSLIWLIESDLKLLKICWKFKPDLLIGSTVSISHVGKLLSKPSIMFGEDDVGAVPFFVWATYPFVSHIVTPSSCDVGKWDYKNISYEGYHELTYLHPNYFHPNKSLIEEFFRNDKRYFILRFAKLGAHHDKGKTGISPKIARRLIEILKPVGNVYITSERRLEKEFEKYRIQIDPQHMHHALYYADMYIGDSQTMAAEAAVLGTPSIRFNDFVGKLGYLEELEHKYGLTFGIKTSEPHKLYQKIKELLSTPDLKKSWHKRKQKMLSEKIDVSAFMVWFIENYPASAEIMRENLSYQRRFQHDRKMELAAS